MIQMSGAKAEIMLAAVWLVAPRPFVYQWSLDKHRVLRKTLLKGEEVSRENGSWLKNIPNIYEQETQN